MRIRTLYKKHKGETVYVVGTGPSLRCLDLDFLRGQVCIGLNQAWRHLATTYSLTVHPELLDAYEKSGRTATTWVVKRKPPMKDLSFDDDRYYAFDTSYDIGVVTARPADVLYLGEGVQTTALDLAARMGARFVVLVGCDGGSLGGDFHAHDQHVKWLGMRPDDQYALYRRTTAAVRKKLRTLGVSVMTLSPFIGVSSAEEDYARLRGELSLTPLPPPKDESGYIRDPKTVRTGE